jgi:hypothetical protein
LVFAEFLHSASDADRLQTVARTYASSIDVVKPDDKGRRMQELRKGDRVQISGNGTGRVIAVLNGSLYRVAYDRPDAFGKTRGDYLADVLRLRSNRR